MNNDKTFLFERMPVKKAVLKQIAPSVASQMVLLIYNLADTYFVGMLNDERQTAAVSVAYTLTVLMTAIANLFAVGAAGCIARALGYRNREDASAVSSVSFWLCLLSSIAFSIIIFFLAEPLLPLFGATADTINIAYDYLKWVGIFGAPFTIVNVLLSNLLRSEGDALNASIGVCLGGFINIALDPVFVLPAFFNMGAQGAGIATAVSNAIGTAFLLVCILKKRNTSVLSFDIRMLSQTKSHLPKIMKTGFPSAAQYLLTVVAVGSLMRFMSAYETEAVAALGIVKKLDMLPLYFSIGVSNGILPLLAYNYASGNSDRRRKIFSFGCALSVAFALTCVLCYELLAPQLVSLFINVPLTVKYGASFLRIMVIAMPMMAVCYPMITNFQAMGLMKESLVCSLLRKGLLDIPLLFLLDTLCPMYGCTMVQPVSDLISMIVAIIFYRRLIFRTEAVEKLY